MPISGSAIGINSKVIFAANSHWCNSYEFKHSGQCRAGDWQNGSER